MFCQQKLTELPTVSILIPFSSNNRQRKKNFQWLLTYWKNELPEAEIIVGRCTDKVFCKGKALNDAVKRSTGKVLVILDADAYLSGSVITHCAKRILEELDNHLWYVPYSRLYRLTKSITSAILLSDPTDPLRLPEDMPKEFVENYGHKSKYGNRYGAMITIFPRQALEKIGCFDERFKGWGGEDVALLRALDTLYGKHKITKNNITHLWHPFIGENYQTRAWVGQTNGNSNSKLASDYHKANRQPSKMKAIVDEAWHYKMVFSNKRESFVCMVKKFLGYLIKFKSYKYYKNL